jgi:hypothetical protein
MEQEYFRSFQYFEPDLHSGAIIRHAGRGQGPDFLVEMGNDLIGIEVSRLYTPLADPAIESAEDGILAAACSKAEQIKVPPAHVTLFFNVRRPLRAADRSCIADAVARVVADNMPAEGENAELEGRPGQPSEVDLILINRYQPREVGRWARGPEFKTIETDISDLLGEAIRKKSNRLPKYLETGCNECWLLLVADSFRASGNLALAETRQIAPYSSPFARTYLLDFGRGDLYRLDDSGHFMMTASVRAPG